jgi:hypothetical protein
MLSLLKLTAVFYYQHSFSCGFAHQWHPYESSQGKTCCWLKHLVRVPFLFQGNNMDRLLDLEELHKNYRKTKVRNLSLAILIIIAGIIGLSSILSRSHSTNASVNLTGSTTPISNPTGNNPAPSSASTQSTNSTGSTTQPEPSNTGYSSSNTYNPPSMPVSSNTVPSTSNIATPDPTKCAGIRAQMATATASLDAQAAQLRSQIKTEQNPAQDQQQLISVVNQITAIDETFIPQLTGNMCP